MSPEQMDAEADSLEAAATAYLARAKQLREAARLIRALQSEPAETNALSRLTQYGTNVPMQVSTNSKVAPAPRIRGREITSSGPIAEAADRLGISIKDLAKKIGASYDTARKWSAKGSVPVDVQQQLDRLIADSAGGRRPKASK